MVVVIVCDVFWSCGATDSVGVDISLFKVVVNLHAHLPLFMVACLNVYVWLGTV